MMDREVCSMRNSTSVIFCSHDGQLVDALALPVEVVSAHKLRRDHVCC